MASRITISCRREINAIYYGLLASGYDFAEIGKSADLSGLILRAKAGRIPRRHAGFFAAARQNTCGQYPYWPRAALMESAVFFIGDTANSPPFDDRRYREYVMSRRNLLPEEADGGFWAWISHFPAALRGILDNEAFRRMNRELDCIVERVAAAQDEELRELFVKLETIYEAERMELKTVEVIICPLKCAYSADYFECDGKQHVIIGEWRPESVIHESLHPAVNRHTAKRRDEILRYSNRETLQNSGIDESYFLSNDGDGILNAFEEIAVRKLAAAVCGEAQPADIDGIISGMLRMNRH